MADKELIKTVLTDLFEQLNSRNINYCVLKNYDDLPEAPNAKDVDVLVESSSIKIIKSIFSNLAEHFRIETVLFSRRGSVNRFELSAHQDSVLVVEFWTGIEWYFFPIISNNDIFADKKKHKFFFVASPIHEILTCWLVPFMVGGEMKERYIELFSSVYRNNKEDVAAELRTAFGHGLALQISQRLEKGDVHLEDLRNSMRVNTFFSSLRKYRFLSLKHFFRLSYDVIMHYFGKYPVEYFRGS